MIPVYKIYPALGIARVGDSEEYYIGPEIHRGLPIMPDGKPFQNSDFRDEKKKVRRQAARFYVYKETEDGTFIEEAVPGVNDIVEIEWTVHLANKKPVWYKFKTALGENGYGPNHKLRNRAIQKKADRQKLIIDPGPRTLKGKNKQQHFSRESSLPGESNFPPEHLKPFPIDTLGSIYTDEHSRLIVAGGHGHSGTTSPSPEIPHYANNDNWWDDTSDGPVRAKIHFADGRIIEASPAWVLVAPPKYAPQISNLVTLYDAIYDVAVRFMNADQTIFSNYEWNKSYQPHFEKDIRPILERGNTYPWVVAIPPKPHEFNLDLLGDPDSKYDSMRNYYFEKLRAPDMENMITSKKSGHTMMPYLAGDDCLSKSLSPSRYLTFTQTQYFFLRQWSKGRFTNAAIKADPIHPGHELTKAVLGNCVGGAFSPGIEMTWICRNTQIYAEPFRIKAKEIPLFPLSLDFDLSKGLEPGDATKFMALPWQADFNECSSQPMTDRFVWWWPAQRPLWVFAKTKNNEWKQLPWVGIDFDQTAPDYLCFADNTEMIFKWKELGFIIKNTEHEKGSDKTIPEYIEVDRQLERIDPPSPVQDPFK